MTTHGGARGGHKTDCSCPACTHRRRGQGGETQVRSIRLSDAAWEWLRGRPGGAAGWIEEAMNMEYEHLQAEAKQRLVHLGLPEDLILDESGQTSAEEHWRWLAAASEAEILDWYRNMTGYTSAEK